jgi:hypothetical protein
MAEALQILVVERESLIALDIERTVLATLEGASVTLSRPVESIREGRRFDLVVCDREMDPAILDFWRRRVEEEGCAFVLTTSGDREDGDPDVWPVVRKPFSEDELVDAVRLALSRAERP